MLSALESQILNKSVPQFTRNTTQFMPLLSDQMNSMTRTNHLSKIHFAEMQIIIIRIEFARSISFDYSQERFHDFGISCHVFKNWEVRWRNAQNMESLLPMVKNLEPHFCGLVDFSKRPISRTSTFMTGQFYELGERFTLKTLILE